MGRFRRALVWRLSRSAMLGEIVQNAVHRHPFIDGPADRVSLHPTAVVNGATLSTPSGTITVGEHAFLGHDVSLLTGTHDVGEVGEARQRAVPTTGHDIVIEAGAWVASRAIIIGPCTVGRNAVVAAGAVVTKDVAAGAIVAGVPARQVSTVPAPR